MREITGGQTKEFQDFFTPPEVSQTIADYLAPKLVAKHAETGEPVTLLEPAVGSGSLIWPVLAGSTPVVVTCLDVQDWCLEYVVNKACEEGYEVAVVGSTVRISNVKS